MPAVYPYQDAAIPPRAMWVGPADPLAHFMRWPYEYRAYLTLLCSLRRDAHVLELGCNHGRTAIGLLDYLRPPGDYVGLDILAAHVEFAQRNITRQFPHFRFVHADLANGLYNPHGTQLATEFVFPMGDGTVDVAYAASLFTHLLPPVVAHYLQQTARVLKPGGSCLFSFFIADSYHGHHGVTSEFFRFDYGLKDHPGILIRDRANPESLIAYPAESVRALAESSGLRVERVLPGLWSDSSQVAYNEQDLVLLSKP